MLTDSSLFTQNQTPNQENRLNFLKKLSKKDWLLLACMSSGLLFVLIGLALLVLTEDPVKASSAVLPLESEQELFVDVSGAVANPGIYSIRHDERVAGAISAAGGLVELADSGYVAESLNLAKTLSDGEKIYIPFIVSSDSPAKENIVEIQDESIDTLISINNATEAQLDQLPKVGAVTAQKIITGRPYASTNELIEKKVVTSSVWAEIYELIKI